MNSSFFIKNIKLIRPIFNSVSGVLRVKILDVEWLDEVNGLKKELLKKTSIGYIYSPGKERSNINLPNIYSYFLDNVIVSNSSSSFIINNAQIIIERLNDSDQNRINYNAGHLLYRKNDLALVKYKNQTTIKEGFFLAGNGCFNYYHWLVEILSKAEFLGAANPDFPLIVSADLKNYKTFTESLMVIAPDRKLIYLEKDHQYLIEKMVYVTTPSNLPFNLEVGARIAVKDFRISFSSLSFLRSNVMKYVSPGSESITKVFLKRDNFRRSYNQDDVEAILIGYGFTSIFCEELSFLQQVELFNNAKYIVGPTGAAWSNLVFGNKGCKALCWMAEDLTAFSAFSTIAHFAGVDISYFFYPTNVKSTAQLYGESYHVGIDMFKKELNKLSDSFCI